MIRASGREKENIEYRTRNVELRREGLSPSTVDELRVRGAVEPHCWVYERKEQLADDYLLSIHRVLDNRLRRKK